MKNKSRMPKILLIAILLILGTPYLASALTSVETEQAMRCATYLSLESINPSNLPSAKTEYMKLLYVIFLVLEEQEGGDALNKALNARVVKQKETIDLLGWGFWENTNLDATKGCVEVFEFIDPKEVERILNSKGD